MSKLDLSVLKSSSPFIAGEVEDVRKEAEFLCSNYFGFTFDNMYREIKKFLGLGVVVPDLKKMKFEKRSSGYVFCLDDVEISGDILRGSYNVEYSMKSFNTYNLEYFEAAYTFNLSFSDTDFGVRKILNYKSFMLCYRLVFEFNEKGKFIKVDIEVF